MNMKQKLRKMRKNLKLYYAFRVLCTMNFVMPIFMLFFVEKGLSSFEIFVTQAAYTLAELLLTVPSGAFADKVGRKKTLILSTVLYSMGFVAYSFSEGFVHILLAEMVFAVSSAAFHGTGEAFLYDTLAEAKQEKRYKKVVGNAYAIQSVMCGIASVAGGFMAKYGLVLPFMVSAVPTALSVVPQLFMDEPKRKKAEDESYVKLIKGAAMFVMQHKRLRNVMYFVGVTTLAGYMGFMLYQPVLTEMGMDVVYLGLFVMCLAVFSAAGNKLAHRLSGFRASHLMLAFAGGRTLLYFLVYMASGYYLVVWAMLIDLVSGVASTMVPEWVNRYSRSEDRATVLSLSSMSGTLMFSVFSPLLALAVDAYSAQFVYLLLSMVLGAYAVRQLVVVVYGSLARKRA